MQENAYAGNLLLLRRFDCRALRVPGEFAWRAFGLAFEQD
jgi:hypothetical protein